MKMKVLAIQAILMLAVCVQVEAGAVFPSVVEAPGPQPYDAIVDSLSFSVVGQFDDANGNYDFDDGDSAMFLLRPTFSNGFDVSGEKFGILFGAGMASGNLVALPLGAFLNNVIGPISSSAYAVALGSEVFDFSTITSANLASLNSSTINAEFSLNEGNLDFTGQSIIVSGDPGTLFSLTFDAVVAENNLASLGTPTNFLPVNGGDFSLFTSLFPPAVLIIGDTAGQISGNANGLVNPVPEPASILTLLGCVAGACVMGRRRRKVVAV